MLRVQKLLDADGLAIRDVVCTAGPRDRAYEEQHASAGIALVSEGSFEYRSSRGAALLAPAALLLGNAGDCYECGHAHAAGDRCISFHYSPVLFESVARALPRIRSAVLPRAALPPSVAMVPLFAEIERARDRRDAAALEALALTLAGTVLAAVNDSSSALAAPSARDAKRITAAVRALERDPADTSLAALARAAAMSPYHFLRTFRAVVGMAPHQYLLRLRLQRAARRLRAESTAVADIAYDCGFADLSTFNRRFRRVTGLTPTQFRSR